MVEELLANSEIQTDSVEKKRVSDESDNVVIDSPADSTEKKQVRDESDNVVIDSPAESVEKKRVRDEFDDGVIDSPEVKRLRYDLFDVLEDSDPEPVSQDLDSVMKSFEDELSTVTMTVGETMPNLGYLLEASDEELGLPPPLSVAPVSVTKEEETRETVTDLVRASSDSSGIDEIWGFEDHVSNYGDLDFGSGVGGDYVAVEGLFEFPDDPGDLFSWRSESLPAE